MPTKMPSTSNIVCVSIVEDEADISENLARLINESPGFRCHSCFSSGEALLQTRMEVPPDVVLVDINLGGMSGIECVRRLRRLFPKVHVLMLTVYEDSDRVFESILAGASGYLLKRTPHDRLLEAIRDVTEGGSPMTTQIARKLVQFFQAQEPRGDLQCLTPREQQVLEALAQGYLYKEIAVKLEVSLDTIRKHISNIYEKLHVRSRTEAVVRYFNKSLTPESKPSPK